MLMTHPQTLDPRPVELDAEAGRIRRRRSDDIVGVMVTIDDARTFALSLPEAVEGLRYGYRSWSVGGKTFAWERPFSKADIKRFGNETPPTGPIVAVTVEDLGEKEAVLAANPVGFFTIQHFNNYPAVLVQLDVVSAMALREAITDGWLACAPPTLATTFLAQQP
jgi:hypothetical protein